MVKVQTKSGFVCKVDENKVKDWRFVKALAKCDASETMVQGLSFVVPFLLGVDGEDALMEHIKDENDLYPTDKIMTEMREILEQTKIKIEAKKSSSSPE